MEVTIGPTLQNRRRPEARADGWHYCGLSFPDSTLIWPVQSIRRALTKRYGGLSGPAANGQSRDADIEDASHDSGKPFPSTDIARAVRLVEDYLAPTTLKAKRYMQEFFQGYSDSGLGLGLGKEQ